MSAFMVSDGTIDQCSEGKIPEMPLYKLLDTVIEDLTHQAARHLGILAQQVEQHKTLRRVAVGF